MKVNITKKNIIVAVTGFLAGVIITTSGFLIFRCAAHGDHKRIAPPSYSQSREIKDGNSTGQSKKNNNDGDKNSKSQTSKTESGASTAENSSGS